MTVSYIEGSDINNLSNTKTQINELNIQYNSEFISNSQIDLNVTNYSVYIYEKYFYFFINLFKLFYIFGI